MFNYKKTTIPILKANIPACDCCKFYFTEIFPGKNNPECQKKSRQIENINA